MPSYQDALAFLQKSGSDGSSVFDNLTKTLAKVARRSDETQYKHF